MFSQLFPACTEEIASYHWSDRGTSSCSSAFQTLYVDGRICYSYNLLPANRLFQKQVWVFGFKGLLTKYNSYFTWWIVSLIHTQSGAWLRDPCKNSNLKCFFVCVISKFFPLMIVTVWASEQLDLFKLRNI